MKFQKRKCDIRVVKWRPTYGLNIVDNGSKKNEGNRAHSEHLEQKSWFEGAMGVTKKRHPIVGIMGI